MAIAFRCGACDRYYEVDESLAGKRGKCKGCGAIFEVPTPAAVAADDPYGLDDPYALSRMPEPAPPDTDEPGPAAKPGAKKKKKKKRGGSWLSNLSTWEYRVYLGVVVGCLLGALIVPGTTKLPLALAGGFLCVAPLVAAGFQYKFGVPFRDGFVTGLMYIFVFPYRIHYNLTHREEFARVGPPKLGLRDFLCIPLGLAMLPVLLLAAKAVDEAGNVPAQPKPAVVDRPAIPPGRPRPEPAPAKKPIEVARNNPAPPEPTAPPVLRREREHPKMEPRRKAAPPFAAPAGPPAYDRREAIVREVQARMEELVGVLAGVVDLASARDAAPKLRALARSFDDAERQLDRIPRLAADDDARLRSVYDGALQAAVARYAEEAARVMAIPGVAAILPRDVLAFRPFVPGTDIRIAVATPRPATPAPGPAPFAMPAPPPPPGADSTVTINVGGTDGPTNQAINAALIELLKAGGNNWSLRSNTAGGRTWFTVSPVGDVQAFADRLTFAKETKVDGRTIDVIVDPTRLAARPN